MDSTDPTRITRLRHTGTSDRAELDALLERTYVGHFALAVDAQPRILPTAVVRVGDDVLAHGSTGSPWMRALAGGASTCLAVTALDGIVVARSAFESSLHYRSAVLFGCCTPVAGSDKPAALDAITERLIPGRTVELRRPTARELEATLVLRLPIELWSMKVSAGWPSDPFEDLTGRTWAGVVPLSTVAGEPVAAPDLREGIPTPASVANLVSRQ